MAEIGSGDIDDLLSAAQKVSNKLRFQSEGEYAAWLQETVGSLRVQEPDVIRALAELKLRIATTNYDSLIEDVTGLPTITWNDHTQAQAWFHGEPGVLHIHGHWRSPDSVILGISSYEEILHDEHTAQILRTCLIACSVVFIGFGAGLTDPNFGALLRWARNVLATSKFRHFRLARQSEVAELQTLHPPSERIYVLPIGQEHADLSPFIRSLRPSRRSAGVTQYSLLHEYNQKRSEIERRIAALDTRRTTLSPNEYIEELLHIVSDLWDAGGARSAWTLLAGGFRQVGPSLEVHQRVSVGLKIAQMMIDDLMPDAAVHILQALENDATQLPDEDARKATYFQIQSKCFSELGAYSQAVKAIQQSIQLAPDADSRDRLRAELAELHLLQGRTDEALYLDGGSADT